MSLIDLQSSDIDKVLEALPEQVMGILAGNPQLAVAGGFVRDTIIGEAPKDINLVGAFTGPSFPQSSNAPSGSLLIPEWNIAGISVRQIVVAAPVEQWVEQRFDFFACMAMVRFEQGTWLGRCHERFYEEARAKRLTLVGRERIKPRQIHRVMRLLGRGWTISHADLAQIVAAAVVTTQHARERLIDERILGEALAELWRPPTPTPQPLPGWDDRCEICTTSPLPLNGSEEEYARWLEDEPQRQAEPVAVGAYEVEPAAEVAADPQPAPAAIQAAAARINRRLTQAERTLGVVAERPARPRLQSWHYTTGNVFAPADEPTARQQSESYRRYVEYFNRLMAGQAANSRS